MTIEEKKQAVIDDFSMYDEWLDKYEYLIELGKSLEAFDEEKKTEDRLIKGCQSRVWLDAQTVDGKVVFSESETQRGLYGRLRWSSSGGRGAQTFEDKTTDGIESKSSLNRHFDIDIRTSFLLGMEGTRQGLRDEYPGVWSGQKDEVPDDSLINMSWLMAGVLRIQGSFFFLGIGGGFAVNWLTTQVPTHIYGSTYQTESENLWTEFRPLVVGELGFFAGAVNEWEFGAREVYLSDPDRPISYLSGFVGFYVFNLEVGWANCPNYFSQLYAGMTFRLPFSLFM